MLIAKAKGYFKSWDLFTTSQFMRYNDDTSKSTYTGAFFSLMIYGVIIYLIITAVSKSVNKSQIEWRMKTIKQSAPSISTFGPQNLPFSIAVIGEDLTKTTDRRIMVYAYWYKTGKNIQRQSIEIPLEPCKQQDWSQNKQISKFYKQFAKYSLCLPKNQSFQIGGLYDLQGKRELQIYFTKCGDFRQTNCDDQSQINNFVSTAPVVSLDTINPFVQADSIDPISSYRDQQLLVLHQQFGQQMYVRVAEYQVETDLSLMPWNNFQTHSGLIVQQHKKILSTKFKGILGTVIVQKSRNKNRYQRQLKKLDDILSYGGGLIGIIVALFFFMLPYSQISFELSLSNKIYKDQQGNPVNNQYNFIHYILSSIYGWTKAWCCCLQGARCLRIDKYDMYQRCSERINRQLDVCYLIRRITTLERLVTSHNSNFMSILIQKYSSFSRIKLDQAQEKDQHMNKQMQSNVGSSQKKNNQDQKRPSLEMVDQKDLKDQRGNPAQFTIRPKQPGSALENLFIGSERMLVPQGLEGGGHKMISEWDGVDQQVSRPSKQQRSMASKQQRQIPKLQKLNKSNVSEKNGKKGSEKDKSNEHYSYERPKRQNSSLKDLHIFSKQDLEKRERLEKQGRDQALAGKRQNVRRATQNERRNQGNTSLEKSKIRPFHQNGVDDKNKNGLSNGRAHKEQGQQVSIVVDSVWGTQSPLSLRKSSSNNIKNQGGLASVLQRQQ